VTDKKRGGLSLPTGSAGQALQDLMKDEQRPVRIDDPLPDPTPPLQVPSPEAVREPSYEGRKAQSRTPMKFPVQEGVRAVWTEDVKERAKAGGNEGRKVRLNVDVDEAVHLRMKIWCITNGFKFNEMIPALIAAFLDEARE